MLIERTFEDGTVEIGEFKTLAAAKKAKGGKKVGIIKILNVVTGAIMSIITLIKAIKK